MSDVDGWLTTGTADRSPVQMFPVTHLLVKELGELWCSGGKGRPDNPLGNRLCPKCRALARERVADGTLSPEGARRWA